MIDNEHYQISPHKLPSIWDRFRDARLDNYRLRQKTNRLVWGHVATAIFLFLLFLYALGDQWSAAWVIGLVMCIPVAFMVLEEEE